MTSDKTILFSNAFKPLISGYIRKSFVTNHRIFRQVGVQHGYKTIQIHARYRNIDDRGRAQKAYAKVKLIYDY